jgi:hypothetical protein
LGKFLRTSTASVILIVAPAISSFARSIHPASSTNDLNKILALGVALVVGLVFAAINAGRKLKPLSKEKVAQLGSEAMALLKQIEAGKFTPPDTPLLLGMDETALLHEPSRLIEARATRVYAGGGTRVQGIYVGGGQSTSVQSLKELDSGTLTLTTKRLVFTGTMESRVVNGKDIVSVEPLADAIEISTVRKAKRQVYLVRNPIVWATLLRTVIKGGISVLKKAPVAEEVRESAQLSQPESGSSTDIRFNCPHCGQHLTVEERGAGTLVNCPTCSEQIEIPGSAAPPLPPSVRAL